MAPTTLAAPIASEPRQPVAPTHDVWSAPRLTGVRVAGRLLHPTPVFDTYWRFAAKRQALYLARAQNCLQPWTLDPILAAHRFTNCYRAADRVSQYLIGDVAYPGRCEPSGRHAHDDVVFRTLLFKFFNRISTWQLLENALDSITWRTWCPATARAVLDRAAAADQRLYSAAYVIPPPGLGGPRKHHDHLLLLETMMADELPARLARASSLRQVFELLRDYRGLGDFLAFQFTIDLNYSIAIDFDENDFVVAGPGARDGIRKCFGPAARGIESEIISYMTDTQDEHFERLGIGFQRLGGRALHRIDCQNLFCEVDKYARVAHPDVVGISGRMRIKQNYRADAAPMPASWFPPKWGINSINSGVPCGS